MKRIIYILIGIITIPGLLMLYSFKTNGPEVVECVIIKLEMGDIFIFHSDGRVESAEKLLKFKIGNPGNGGFYSESAFAKTIEHFYLNGYKVMGENNMNDGHGPQRSYTLIKEN
ncbi:MAG: hypothetical protein IT247_03930 [Bacteroidia bacterium]|nr:hypothetical protein [Bacteroidia bacterium]